MAGNDTGNGWDGGTAGQEGTPHAVEPGDGSPTKGEAPEDGFEWNGGPAFDPDRGIVGLEGAGSGADHGPAPTEVEPSFGDDAPLALDIPDEPVLSTHLADGECLPDGGASAPPCGQGDWAAGAGNPLQDGGAVPCGGLGQRLDGDVEGMTAAERAEIVQERERYQPKGQGFLLKLIVVFALIGLMGFGLKFLMRRTVLGGELEARRVAAGKYLSHAASPRRTKCGAGRAQDAAAKSGHPDMGNPASDMGDRIAAEIGVLQRAFEDAVNPDIFLVVESQPSGAEITVDGQRVLGDTPFGGNNPFSKGEHSAVLRLKGYQPAEVKFQGGVDSRIDVKLVPLSKDGRQQGAGGQEKKTPAPGKSPAAQKPAGGAH